MIYLRKQCFQLRRRCRNQRLHLRLMLLQQTGGKNTIYFYNKIAIFATFLLYRFDYTIIYSAGRASLRRKSVCYLLDVQNIKGKRKPNAATKISTPVNIAHSCHVSPLTMRFTVLNPEKVAPTVARKTKTTIKIEGSIFCTTSFSLRK